MKPVIRSLTLKRFRSFDLERVELDNPTFVVGRNATGKSNLVDALSFLREAMRQPLDEVIRRRGGISSIVHQPESKPSFGLRVELGGRGVHEAYYGLEIRTFDDHSFEIENEQCRVTTREAQHWFNRDRDTFSSNVKGLKPPLDPHWLVLPVLGGNEGFRTVFRHLYLATVFQMRTDLLRQAQKVERNDRLLEDWSNAANVLNYIQEHSQNSLDRINEILSALTPVPTRVKPRIQGGMVSLEFEQQFPDGSKACFDALEMSTGTLQVLGILIAVFQRSFGSLLVFEEPEVNIYPGALSIVTDLLQSASKDNQVLVTTQSPELLDTKWITDRHLRIVYWEGRSSRVSEVGKASREALRGGLMGAGELLRSSVLDTPPVHRAQPDDRLFEVLA
jgi:predicted ATPase